VASPLLPLTRARATLIRQLLKEKQVRAQEGAFVLEGAKFCLDLIRSHPSSILSLLCSSRYLRYEDEASRQLRSTVRSAQYTCSDQAFEALSDVEAPQGLLAIVRQPQWDQTFVMDRDRPRLLGLYGDQLRDPANVGAIIRTAAALQLTAVWLSADSADWFAPKVTRSAAGAIMTVPIFRQSAALTTFSQYGCQIYSAVLPSPDAVSLKSIETIPDRVIIAVGNEGAGLPTDIQQASALKFCIPLARDVESLNVAATVAIAAFHFSGLPRSVMSKN
jgi:RNA methyltransferase, TrmH family